MSATVRAGYKQTEVGIIPEGWDVRPLLSAVRIANGQVDPREYPYSSMTLVAPDHIEGRTGRLLERRTAADQKAISGKYLFSHGDIVYSKIRPYLRKAVLVDFAGLCSADMYPLKAVADVDAGFMLPVLLGERFSGYAESVSARSGMPKINRAELAEYGFALPPIHEQRAIATALSDVDALLTNIDALIAKKRDLKQAVMQQLITGQTRLPGFSGEWEMMRLGNCLLARPDYGINAPAVTYSDLLPTYVRITDITDDGRFSPEKLTSVASANSPNYYLSEGDIVFARTGASVGKSYRYKLSDGELVFAGFLIRVRPDQRKLLPAFLTAYVATDAYWSWVGVMSMRSGQPGINGNEFAQLRLPVPTLEEQIAIATILSDMDAELVALEARHDKTRALKQGMMQELLTGRIRLV